tara:strand:+ start:738 stop:2267 length:1530 start_codon:yes stop_codon:yes gene_type:complete
MIKKLHTLLSLVGIEIPLGLENPFINSICSDSRNLRKGCLFFGLPGEKVNGGTFLHDAFLGGAAAAVVDSSSIDFIPAAYQELVVVVPDQVCECMGELAAAFWEYPTSKIDLIGVTGTNGKTTTTLLIEHLSAKGGMPTALLGTLFNRWPNYSETATHTTALADTLQLQLAKAVGEGARLGIMEVSSHALSQRRVAGCRFSASVFTNLTQDHLDYHESMEAYFEAKALLFASPLLKAEKQKRVIINIDDIWGDRLSKRLGEICWEASLDENTIKSGRPDLFITDIQCHASGVKGILHSPYGKGSFQSPLIGRFNLMNLLQAVGVLLQHDFVLEELLNSINDFDGVPGRMEQIRVKNIDNLINMPTVIVDYAHTPDGLKNALIASRPLASKKLICVFGCGGDRDKGKRPKMGSIASQLADSLIITSDNPRTENPQQIIEDVRKGILINADVIVETDRATAIDLAISNSSPGDVILIAGKGHEDYQILGDTKVHFEDREKVRESLLNNFCS